jgi:hypothetical protein
MNLSRCPLRMTEKTVVFVLLMVGISLADGPLPQGWRHPSPQHVSGKWRNESPSKFLTVRGDFDGDGQADLAELLVDTSGKHYGLFVRLPSSSSNWQKISDGDATHLSEYGINSVSPGSYETACGKGYGDYACAHGEPDFLKLSTDAIDFFYHESSDIIFYWDRRMKKFRKIQMSD